MPKLFGFGLVGLLSFGAIGLGQVAKGDVGSFTQLEMIAGDLALSPVDDGLNKQVYGVINYGGGFEERAHVEFQTPVTLRSFSIHIPAFCTGVEVLEAGVLNGRGEVAAIATDGTNTVFNVSVRGPVNGLWVTLNGPDTSSCTIPLISNTGSTPPPATAVDGNYGGQRGVLMVIQGGFVTNHNLTLQNNMTGVQSPVVFTAKFARDSFNPSIYTTLAYSDGVIYGNLGQAVVCRSNIKVTINPLVADFSQIALSATYPDQVYLDVFGRCAAMANRTDTLIVNRQLP